MNNSGTLYIGMTNNLERRVWAHKNGTGSQFTRKYKINRLVYFETTTDVNAAIAREKQLKKWSRRKKIKLINSMNPKWQDLSDDWFRK